jgi:hypothetical protein
MYAKNTYRLMFGPTDGSGRIEIDRVALEREIRATLSTGLMDYAPFTEWRGEIVVSPFDTYDIARALDGYRTWGRISGGLYPVNFIAKMEALRDRLEKNPDASLTVNVHVDPQDGASVTTRAKRAVAPPDIANPS